jgi:oligoendopeptidase F
MSASEQASSPCYRLTETTGEGMEFSAAMSMRMIENRRNGLQKLVNGMERRIVPLQRQKEDLQLVLNTVNNWVQVLHETERWNSGVPILRSAKENCDDLITPYLNDSESEFNQAVFRLSSAEIPCFAHAQKLLKSVRREIRKIFEKESTFNGKFVEDVRVIMGQVTGIVSAILGLYYQ